MEASALRQTPALAARSPLLRLQGDEKLVALIRRGNHGAFEALVDRYNSRLLAFCRHMLGSTEDAEDVLQEVFTAAFNAICADERPINARPWLYRIARNRCLNHLRRPQHAGQDSMDVFERDGGATTADTVHTREEFRQIVADVGELPESQRTALLLREIDALSYEQIFEAMDTTVPSVKSLLVRARVSLAEAAEARLLTCEEVRLELGQVAEGIARTTAPVRRHLRTCERCKVFRRELRNTSRALAAVYPIGGLVLIKKFILAKLGAAGGGAAASGAAAGGATAGGGAAVGGAGLAGAGAVAGGATASGVISAGVGAVATKAAAGLAAAAIVTAGAVEVKHASHPAHSAVARAAVAQVATPEPQVVSAQPQVVASPHRARHAAAKHKAAAVQKTLKTPAAQPAQPPAAVAPTPPNQTNQGDSTVTLPQQGTTGPTGTEPDPTATGGAPQPSSSQPAPTTPTDPTQPAPQPTPTSTDPSSSSPPPPPPPSDSDPSDQSPQNQPPQDQPPPRQPPPPPDQ